MMQLVLLAVLADDAVLLEQLRAARDSRTIEALARDVPVSTSCVKKSSGEVVLELAEAWSRVGDFERTAQTLRCYEDRVFNGRAELLCARGALERERPRSAITALERARFSVHRDPLILTRLESVAERADVLVGTQTDDRDAGRLLLELARVWRVVGEHLRALELADRVAREWGEPLRKSVALVRAEVAADMGWSGDAVTLYLEAGGTSGEESPPAYHGLAMLYERAGLWRDLLAHLERWRPRSTCGNGQEEIEIEWTARMTRCRFELGDVDEALRASFALATGDYLDGAGSPVGADLYVELAARAGRLEDAAKQLAHLGASKRALLAPRVALAAHVARDDATALVACVARDPSLTDLGATLLRRMPSAGGALASAVGNGNAHVIRLASKCHGDELVPVLERRLLSESDADVRRAIQLALIALLRPEE